MVLLAWLLSRVKGPILLAGQALALLSLAVAVYLPIQTQRKPWNYLTLPAGRTAIPDRGWYELYRWTAEHTHPGEVCFGVTPIYLPLRLHSPAPIDPPGPWSYYRPEQIAAIDRRSGREQSPCSDPQRLLGRSIDMELQSR